MDDSKKRTTRAGRPRTPRWTPAGWGAAGRHRHWAARRDRGYPAVPP